MNQKELTAPEVDSFISIFKGGKEYLSNNALKLVDELYEVLSEVKSCGEDNRKELWLKAKRGTIENFFEYDEEEYGSYEEFQNYYLRSYPDEEYLYKLLTVEYKEYKSIILKHELVIAVDPNKGINDWCSEQLCEFLNFLISASIKCIQELKIGTYNENVKNNLPYKDRKGTIVRNDFWKVFPEYKKYYFEDITKEEVDEFIDLMINKKTNRDTIGRIKEMTAHDFYEYCSIGYRANNYDVENLSFKEQYYKFADGRDNGLSEIDENSPDAFYDWLTDKDRIGGHPYEICRGGNSTHVSLYVLKDEKGYFLGVAGKSYGRSIEAIKIYLALRRKGIPVIIYNGVELAHRMMGVDKIGIVPEGITPVYCETMFPDEEILDFINFDEDKQKLVPYIKWQDEIKQELV